MKSRQWLNLAAPRWVMGVRCTLCRKAIVSEVAFRRLPREARCRPVVYGRFSVALRSCPGRFSVLPTHRLEPPWMADPVSVRPSWLKLSHYRNPCH